MVCSGFSDVIGSWKIIAIRLPRTCREHRLVGAQQLLRPWKTMLPDGWRAGG